MPEKTINIKKGELTLKGEGLRIEDDSVFNRNLLIISSFFWCFYGVINILQYPAKDNFFYFYFGVFILALWVAVIGFVIFRVSFKKEFAFAEIEKAKFKKNTKGLFAGRIQTKSGRIRTFTLNEKKEDVNALIRQFKKQKIKLNLEELK